MLDGVDTILQSNIHAGNFQPGYENYGELFKRLGESNHQSCLLLTSREKLKQVSSMEGVSFPVRCLSLIGFGGVRELLDQHLNRLSKNEWKIMQWLAINQEIKLTSPLTKEIVESILKAELIEVLESLNRRSLIYKSGGSFKLKHLFREYLNEQLGQQTCQKNFSDLIQQSYFSTYQIVGKLNITDVRNTQKLNE